jgi:hypothetical protein
MQIWLQVSLLLVVMAVNDMHHDIGLLPPGFFSPPIAVEAPLVKEAPTEDIYDKALKKDAASSLPFSNITAFNEQNSKQEAYIDWLKERYEAWFVTYYYLQKCKKTGNSDYDIIRHSLEKELATAHASKSVEDNILLAATGSYKEMYSEIPCDNAHLGATKSLYDANMQQAMQRQAQSGTQPKPQPQAKTTNTH